MRIRAFRGCKGRNCTVNDSTRSQLQTAIETEDYTTFTELTSTYNIAKGRIFTAIDSPEDFQLLSELHNAIQAGDIDTGMEIRQELGLPLSGGYGYAHGSGPTDGTGNQHRGKGPHASGDQDGTGPAWR